jgi:hypothetical protein
MLSHGQEIQSVVTISGPEVPVGPAASSVIRLTVSDGLPDDGPPPRTASRIAALAGHRRGAVAVPTKIVFSAESSVEVVDEPHEVIAKLKEGTIQFEQAADDRRLVHLLNPALILYLEKIESEAASSAQAAA